MKVVISKTLTSIRTIPNVACAVACAGVLVTSCKTATKPESENANTSTEASAYVETIEAGKYLNKMVVDGKLPWLAAGEQGKLDSDPFPLSEVTYPIVRIFSFKKTNDASICHYQVVKQARNATWRLENAWWFDSHGNTIETWPKPVRESEPYTITKVAWQYVADLAAKEQLPWLIRGETGKLVAEDFEISKLELEFPVVRAFLFTKSDGSVCHYQVVKQSRRAEWQLEKAWRVDPKGNTINTWPDKGDK